MNAKYIFSLLCVSLLLLGKVTMAQSLSRQTLCSAGSSNAVNGFLVSLTIGQPYQTDANYNNGLSYRPGFQQPSGVQATSSGRPLNLRFFPNPVLTSLTIQSGEVIPNAIISIVDLEGKTIYSSRVSNLTTFTMDDCQQWPNGTYILKISDGKSRTYSSNIIVMHY